MKVEKVTLDLRKEAKRLALIFLGSFVIAMNLKTFVHAGGLFPGGFTGLTILTQNIGEKYFNVQIPFSVMNLILNAIPAIIAFKSIGKKFTIYTCIGIVCTSILTDCIPVRPIVYDVLLICIFGGIINGFAISLCLRAGACSGGADFIAIYASEKLHVDVWNYILCGNAIMLMVAGYLFGWNQALYSIIFQFTTTQVLHALHKHYRKHTFFIITDYPEEVYDVIYHCTKHGATIFKGTGCYDNETRSMVYSVVSTDEVKLVKEGVRLVDPKAFINVIKTDQLDGRFYQKPNE